MTKLTVIGGGGYAGGHIVEAAAVRGLSVTSITRHEVPMQGANISYATGSLLNQSDRARALSSSDVVVVAVSPRGDMAEVLREAIRRLAFEADAAGVRLGVIGGAGSLQAEPGGPRLYDLPTFAQEVLAEAKTMGGVLDDLQATPDSLNWFMVCPPVNFGPGAPGEFVGEYRVGEDVLLTADDGSSAISGADFGVAVIDEVEDPAHRRRRFTVAY